MSGRQGWMAVAASVAGWTWCVLFFAASGMAIVAGQEASTPAPMPTPTLKAPFVTLDLTIGEKQVAVLPDGRKVEVKLVDLIEKRDDVRGAVRHAEVKIEVAGQAATLFSANYRLPTAVGGVRVDCPVTAGYTRNASKTTGGLGPWGLEKDARIRVWPADGPLLDPTTFKYPARQRWFASATQMANEPVYVDGGEKPGAGPVYYHYGLDIGGAEAHVDVVAATDGLVVSVGTAVLPGYKDTPVAPRYDVVYLLDDRGWYYRYSHLHTINSQLKPGVRVKLGQPIGLLGKEGGSGGWSHLHFDISGRQPSGKWGIIEGYAFLWESYLAEFQPKLIAVARPHLFALTGDSVMLDGARSWSSAGAISKFEWTCTDGRRADGRTLERTYDRPGCYSEILKVTDAQGNVDYDFAIVHVLDKKEPARLPPSIHATYSPTRDIRPGTSVKFLVRTFRTTAGQETWDFGDGSPTITVKSDGNVKPLAVDGYAAIEHVFQKPGVYLPKVQRTDDNGYTATARLKVVVDEK